VQRNRHVAHSWGDLGVGQMRNGNRILIENFEWKNNHRRLDFDGRIIF
jgi:hypothetical protein